MEHKAMRTILAAAVLAVLALPASAAKDNPHGPQWHFMDHDADMRLLIRPWCVPHTPQWATCSHVTAASPGPSWGWPYGGPPRAAVRR
jgi:hypothetical protein